jgi:hypothetical protein
LKTTADLELLIRRQDQQYYTVDFRFTDNDSENQGDIRRRARFTLDLAKLNELVQESNYQEYGKFLTNSLFADEILRTEFAKARTAVGRSEGLLRIRLAIDAGEVELHPLRWETLRDPQSNIALATDQNIHLSRYHSSMDWRPIRLRARGELKALVAIAAPIGLTVYKLANVDKDKELTTIRNGLGNIRLKLLERATLNNIITALTETQYDILYLVAHGTTVNNEPFIWLENEDGQIARVQGSELVVRMRELENRPRLAVLTSCQSAGRGEGDILSALGPRLAEIGVPAVLAMQDNISMVTVAKFMPSFFNELQRDGRIDRALNVARGMIREQTDWWVPVLFMRLKSGRLWYTPGFADVKKGFEKFPAQIQNIKNKHFTPILGPGLVENLLGSSGQIARDWAEKFHYPLSPHECESLPQVAQYLTINQQRTFPYNDLISYLRERLQKRFKENLSVELVRDDAPVWQVLDAVGKKQRLENVNEPHCALAELPVEVYLTANNDMLLEGALEEAGKEPQTRLSPWNEYTAEQEADREDETYTVDRPLVYHLFGLWKERPSIVLTEDDYFDFLLGMSRNKALIPLQVKRAMTDSGLLFLGFQTNEWQFRVLFRGILSLPGRRYEEYANIAAQIEPEDGRILEPQRAREYLEQYFSKGQKIDLSIYWGTPDEFIQELMRYWRSA